MSDSDKKLSASTRSKSAAKSITPDELFAMIAAQTKNIDRISQKMDDNSSAIADLVRDSSTTSTLVTDLTKKIDQHHVTNEDGKTKTLEAIAYLCDRMEKLLLHY